eukprot:1469146-Pleurochrysis_carterae.AAC.6
MASRPPASRSSSLLSCKGGGECARVNQRILLRVLERCTCACVLNACARGRACACVCVRVRAWVRVWVGVGVGACVRRECSMAPALGRRPPGAARADRSRLPHAGTRPGLAPAGHTNPNTREAQHNAAPAELAEASDAMAAATGSPSGVASTRSASCSAPFVRSSFTSDSRRGGRVVLARQLRIVDLLVVDFGPCYLQRVRGRLKYRCNVQFGLTPAGHHARLSCDDVPCVFHSQSLPPVPSWRSWPVAVVRAVVGSLRQRALATPLPSRAARMCIAAVTMTVGM